MKKEKNLWNLFISCFYLSAFTFGGGYVIVSLMKQKFIEELGWIEREELLDMVAISQAAPGAVAVNSSIVVGYKMFGFVGALVAALGTSLPPLIIISIISVFYEWFKSNRAISLILTGMQAGIVALLVKVIIDMGSEVLKADKKLALFLMALVVVLSLVFHITVIYIILGFILAAAIYTLVERRKNAN